MNSVRVACTHKGSYSRLEFAITYLTFAQNPLQHGILSFLKVHNAVGQQALSSVCQKNNNGPWVWSTIDLNDHLGIQDGTFDMETINWYGSAVHEKTSLSGTLLRTVLYNRAGKENETCLDLNLCVANIDGILTFQGV